MLAAPAARRWPPEPAGRQAAAPHAAAGGAPALSPSRERGRRLVVRLVVLLFVLAVVEGAIRKFVAPQLGSYIFFLRDPVLLLAYIVATRHRLWPRRSLFFGLSLGMAVFGVLLFVLQAGSGGDSDLRLILGVYGWRAYFLYTPLACLVGEVFRREDLLRLFKLMLWLAVPVAVLVTAQFAAPPGAPINVGISDQKEFQFQGITLNAERTRATGPFASAAGQQQFVAAGFAVLLAYFLSPKRLMQPAGVALLVTAGGLLTCLALGGSRGMVLQCGQSVLAALLVGVVARGGALKSRAFLWPGMLVAVALLAYPILFPEGYEAFTGRWQVAADVEGKSFENTGVFGRALFGLIEFKRLIDEVPLLGLGLGYGGNAAVILNAKIDGVVVGFLAETDFARHMVDLGPVFGLGYIGLRLILAIWLTQMALRATRRDNDPMPLLLWSYVGYVLVLGQLTGQGTINFYGWLFTGLLLAACKPPRAPAPGRAARALVRRGPGPYPRMMRSTS